MAVNRPSKIGKYDVIDVIGRGGMGVVYRARDPYLDRPVAIKMMTGSFSENPDLLKRFFREAQSTASLQHPNIVTVYELGDHSGNPYLVMEYLDGESVDSILLSQQKPSLRDKLELVLEVCRGLSYAHQRGVIHRDIKPGNIMVTKNGGVKIVDFGIAHFGDNNNVTRTGQIVGSINYMSPEQVNGRPVDARTDIFSTGVVLYQLLTHSLPFEGESAATTLLKIIDEPAPPLGNFLVNYPKQLDAILDRVLAKDRNQRYSSADELAIDLGQVQSELKQELVTRYMEEARRHIENDDFYRAKEQLLQVLKTDRQNTQASLLLREVQEKIQSLEIGKEVQQLRLQAEEAFAQEQFETAATIIGRALALDTNNTELRQWRDEAQARAVRAQNLRRAISIAESAHQSGDLESAKEAVEQALDIAPNDTHAKALHRAIHRDWQERQRQRQVENYVEQARNEITSRKFTAALELLRKAEALDSAAPDVQALIASARAAQEQERRRRELEGINREIEDALNRDDYQAATLKAEEGLKVFPEERGLLKLKALAAKQREIAEKKRFVEEQLAEARSLLEQGRSEELVGRLESALAKTGGDPRLQSLLLIVRENVRRERLEKRKAEYVQRAKEALRRKQHAEAVRILEAAKADLPDAGEVDDLLQFAKEEAASEEIHRVADAAAEEAHRLIAEHEFEPAIQLLETTLEKVPDEELRILLAEARRAAVDYQKKLATVLNTASNLIRARKPGEALKLLDAQPASFSSRESFQSLRETARRQAELLVEVEEAIRRSQELLASENHSEAARVLEECREAHGSTPELESELSEVLRKQAQAATASVQKSLSDARMLLNAAQYRGALERIVAASQLWPLVSASLMTECETVKQQATSSLAYQRKAEIERRLETGELAGAADLLQRTLTEMPGRRDWSELETIIQEQTARKSQAEAKVAEAQTLFLNADWKKGAELLKKAFAEAGRAPNLRDAVMKTFVEGAQVAADRDWEAAETLLLDAETLEPTFSGLESVSERIAERKRESTVKEYLAAATQAQSTGDLRRALVELERGLAVYRDEPRLKELQNLILNRLREQEERQEQERQRAEKEAFLQQISNELQREPRLDLRVQIAEGALAKYPGDAALERQLADARRLSDRVSELARQADAQEHSQQYGRAIELWETVRDLYPEYPDVDEHLKRIRKSHDDELAAARLAWIEKTEAALAGGEIEQARSTLTQALPAFPQDSRLASLKDQIDHAGKARAKAESSLSKAEKAFSKKQWQKGADWLRRASQEAPHDVVVRQNAAEYLLRAFDTAIQLDWHSGETLLACADELKLEASATASLRERVDSRKKDQFIADCLAKIRGTQQKGDWEGALQRVDDALVAYPGEELLKEMKAQIEGRLRAIEEERRRLVFDQQTQLNLERTQQLSSTITLDAPSEAAVPPVSQPATLDQATLERTVVIDHRPEVKTSDEQLRTRRSRLIPFLAAAGLVAAVIIGFELRHRPSHPSTVRVTIHSDPPGASVRVGDHSCVTPSCQIELPPGQYQIMAQLSGYQSAQQTIALDASKPQSQPVMLVLNPVPVTVSESASNGTLTVRSEVRDALVFVDDIPRGRTDPHGAYTIQLASKSYRIRVEKDSYQPSKERRVDVETGVSRTVDFKMVPLPAQNNAAAKLELKGAPAGVEAVNRPEAPATVPAPSPEEQDWTRTRSATQPADLEAFLKKYPNGSHSKEAEATLDGITWAQTRRDDMNGLQRYIERFPLGANADNARLRLDDLRWSLLNKKDIPTLSAFSSQYPKSRHYSEAQELVMVLKPLDLFWAAFLHQEPRELKEVWPGASNQYLQAVRPPAGYKVAMKLQPTTDPIITGATAEVACDLISDTTHPGGQLTENKKRVKVSLYKNGDRWLISNPFGQ